MQKKKNPAKSARTTLSSVKREMLEPRLTESVRDALADDPRPLSKKLCLFPENVSSVRANVNETLVEVSGASGPQLMAHPDICRCAVQTYLD
jgi:hypothetical protein